MMENLENVETITDAEGGHGVVMKFKKARVYGVRDFPKGCGPLKSHSCEEDLGSLVKLKVPCLVPSLEEDIEEAEEELVSEENEATFDFETSMFIAPASLEEEELVCEENEAAFDFKTSPFIAPASLEKEELVCEENEAAFDFETSPFITPASLEEEELVSEENEAAFDFETSPMFVTTPASLDDPDSVTTTTARVYPPRRGSCSGVRSFPPGCGRNSEPRTTDESSKPKVISNDMASAVVLGLMVPQNCPWSQNKRRCSRAK